MYKPLTGYNLSEINFSLKHPWVATEHFACDFLMVAAIPNGSRQWLNISEWDFSYISIRTLSIYKFNFQLDIMNRFWTIYFQSYMYVLTHFSWMIGCVSGVHIYTVKWCLFLTQNFPEAIVTSGMNRFNREFAEMF